jgi:hypothetical protein
MNYIEWSVEHARLTEVARDSFVYYGKYSKDYAEAVKAMNTFYLSRKHTLIERIFNTILKWQQKKSF